MYVLLTPNLLFIKLTLKNVRHKGQTISNHYFAPHRILLVNGLNNFIEMNIHIRKYIIIFDCGKEVPEHFNIKVGIDTN